MPSGIFNIYTIYTGYHNRRSIRLREYDYSRPGYYFVTICVRNRGQNMFGNVVNGLIALIDDGECVRKKWLEIPIHFPGAKLDAFIIMPNHVHGIIVIGDPVGVQNFEPLHNQYQHITPRSIGSMVRGFKIGVTKSMRIINPGINIWQRNYYEHIIRDEKSLYLIRKYIADNPVAWSNDREHHLSGEMGEFKLEESCP